MKLWTPGDRFQAAGVIVVAGDDHHRSHRGEIEQRPEHDLLRLGGRGHDVEEVAGHQSQVDFLGGGDAGDLGKDGPMLVRPAPPPDRAPDMPVGGMEDLHVADGTGAQ